MTAPISDDEALAILEVYGPRIQDRDLGKLRRYFREQRQAREVAERAARHFEGEFEQARGSWEREKRRADGLAAQLAELPEWKCPSCGATTRAQMADRVD